MINNPQNVTKNANIILLRILKIAAKQMPDKLHVSQRKLKLCLQVNFTQSLRKFKY